MVHLFLQFINSKQIIITLMLNYILFALVLCKLSLKAKIEHEWLAFIPFLQYVQLLHIIDRSGWYILFFILPIVNIILIEVWFAELYTSFDIRVFWIVLALIVYPINCIYMIYMAYSEKIKYVGNSKYRK